MKILVLGSRIPYPTRDGGALATFNLLKEFANQGVKTTYFTFNTKKHFIDKNTIENNFTFCKVIDVYLNANVSAFKALIHLIKNKNYNVSRFNSIDANKKLADLLNSETFDIIHFEGLFTQAFLPIVNKFHKGKIVYRPHNIEYIIWEKLAKQKSGLKKWYLSILSNQLKKIEIDFIRQFNCIVPISFKDEIAVKQINKNAYTHVFAACIYTAKINNSEFKPNTLYHIGSMEWMPNYAAVEWFANYVMPILRAKKNDIQFHIAGKGLKKNDTNFLQQNIFNHGEVMDANEFISDYEIAIVPIFSGSGIRVKILEAMSNKKAVVCTSVAIDGIEAENQTHCMIANTAVEMADAILYLINNEQMKIKIIANAYQLFNEKYELKNGVKKLLEFYANMQ